MNTDIRISVSFKGHRKRKRLQRLLGDKSDSYLIDLWITVSTDCPDGVLSGWDEIDIADACNYDGDTNKLVSALIDCNWLEKNNDGEYSIHDWCEHQAWACKAKQRSESARKAAEKRWEKKTGAKSKRVACESHCEQNAESNAPSLSLPILTKPNIYSKVVEYLNKKTKSSYKPTTKKTKSLIDARLKEGFTDQDFKTVIDNKCADWLTKPEYINYLRPETLFGTKFESYLNSKSSAEPKTTRIYYPEMKAE